MTRPDRRAFAALTASVVLTLALAGGARAGGPLVCSKEAARAEEAARLASRNFPDEPAVVTAARGCTYRELYHGANVLAWLLI